MHSSIHLPSVVESYGAPSTWPFVSDPTQFFWIQCGSAHPCTQVEIVIQGAYVGFGSTFKLMTLSVYLMIQEKKVSITLLGKCRVIMFFFLIFVLY